MTEKYNELQGDLLQSRLKNLLLEGASVDYEGAPSNHPLVVINAVKNILSDVREANHGVLLDRLENWVKGYPKLDGQSDILKNTRKAATGEPVFVSDLTDAVQNGNKELSTTLAAQLHLSAMSPTLVQELLTEVFLQDTAYFAPFCYHWLRANHFIGSDKHIWDFAPSGLSFIGRIELPGPAYPSDSPDFDKAINLVLANQDYTSLVLLMAGKRLLDHEYIRTPNFKNEIYYWVHTMIGKGSANKVEIANDIEQVGLPDFVRILNDLTLNGIINTDRILELEAFRAVFKMTEQKKHISLNESFYHWMKK